MCLFATNLLSQASKIMESTHFSKNARFLVKSGQAGMMRKERTTADWHNLVFNSYTKHIIYYILILYPQYSCPKTK